MHINQCEAGLVLHILGTLSTIRHRQFKGCYTPSVKVHRLQSDIALDFYGVFSRCYTHLLRPLKFIRLLGQSSQGI